MPRAIRIILTLCLTVVLVSACGQKGPLYLPDKENQNTDGATD